jgi:hypothetical protein
MLSFILILSRELNAQEQKHKKTFQSIGCSIPFIDIMKSPVQLITYPVTQISGIYNSTVAENTANSRLYGISFITLLYCFRYNILEISENKALGISTTPAVGFSYLNGWSDNGSIGLYGGCFRGYGNFNLPVFLEYEFGAGATYKSNSSRGLVAGLGLDYTLLPFSKTSNFQNFSYFQFAFTSGYRYLNKHDKLCELNLLICTGSSYTPTDNSIRFIGGYSYEFRLSWVRFIKI